MVQTCTAKLRPLSRLFADFQKFGKNFIFIQRFISSSLILSRKETKIKFRDRRNEQHSICWSDMAEEFPPLVPDWMENNQFPFKSVSQKVILIWPDEKKVVFSNFFPTFLGYHWLKCLQKKFRYRFWVGRFDKTIVFCNENNRVSCKVNDKKLIFVSFATKAFFE